MGAFGAPERVYVELDWYDGPQAGVADVNGKPHRFKSRFDEQAGEYTDLFDVWLIDAESLRLEIEQWQLFVAWNDLYESGKVSTDSHPAYGGVDSRWDEIDALIGRDRDAAPSHAVAVRGQFVTSDRDRRYEASGPGYSMRWCLI